MKSLVLFLQFAMLFNFSFAQNDLTTSSVRTIDGFGFSGSGFYIIYHIGVLSELISSGLLVPGESVIAGASGGAHIAAFTCSGLPVDQQRSMILKSITGCLDGSCQGKLNALDLKMMRSSIPDDSAFDPCIGKAFVQLSVTQPAPAGSSPPFQMCFDEHKDSLLVGDFYDRNDFIDAVSGTSFIHNGLSNATSCTLPWRDLHVMDGGYTNELPCPPGTENNNSCLRVAAIPKALWSEWQTSGGPSCVPLPPQTEIYPGVSGITLPIPLDSWLAAEFDAVKFLPHADSVYELGVADAQYWLQTNSWTRGLSNDSFKHNHYKLYVMSSILTFVLYCIF